MALAIRIIFLLLLISKISSSFKTQSPPIPRQLVDVLADSSLGNRFLAYLEDLDKTNEEFTKQTYLNFALKCNDLRKAANIEEAEKILGSMGAEFFSNGIRAKRLALRNEVTQDQCKEYLENKPDGSKIPKHLWDAENEAHSHLVSLSQDFLKHEGGIANLIKNTVKDTVANFRGKFEF